jgi:multidrug efflux pump subunit AcrA (membrane-fusion protein)
LIRVVELTRYYRRAGPHSTFLLADDATRDHDGDGATTPCSREVQRLQLTVEQAALAAEQARRDLETAQTQFAASQSSVAAAESRLKHHKVVAPSDGLVVRVDVQPGAWVNPGDTVARVIRMDVLRVEALVDGIESGPQLEGQRIVIHPAGAGEATDADQQCAGQITFVSPELHPVTGRVRIWGEIENPDRALRPGMKGKLTIARD